MKKLIIEIDDNYAKLITITAIGGGLGMINASTTSADLSITDKIVIDENGISTTIKGE